MSRAVGKHFQAIRQQRIRLDEYRQHEPDLDALWASETLATMAMLVNTGSATTTLNVQPRTFRPNYDKYMRELDNAEKYLKIAMSIGAVVDISDTALGHDIRLVGQPKHGAHLGNQQRARDNLAALNFHDTTGKLPEGGTHVSKITIPTLEQPGPLGTSPNCNIGQIAWDFLHPEYPTLVLISFEDRNDAMIYRLAV